ncbi:MAG TPA: calcium-binding protein [Azospirillaceae bacterium]|nr:calcium-binding protein [Azospirillaceae bacterium]
MAAVWQTSTNNNDGDIRAQRFDANGAPVGGEVAVNMVGDGHQASPAVAALADGGHLVVWWAATGNAVHAQRFDAAGNRVGGEMILAVNNIPTSATPLQVTGLSDGGYALAWESTDSSEAGIRTQRFTADGTAVGPEQVVATLTTYGQSAPAMTALADGGYVVTWQSYLGDTNGEWSGWGIKGQRFDTTGTKAGGEFLVNTTLAYDQVEASTAALADGGFVVAWRSTHDGDRRGDVYAQRFDAAGAKVGGEVRVNSHTAGFQGAPDIVGLADGGFAVAWTSEGQDGSEDGVYAQRFDAAGLRVGREFRLNEHTLGIQRDVDLAARPDGGFNAVWTSYGQDGSGAGVFGRSYFMRPEIGGTTNHDTLTGTAASEILSGLDGDDHLSAGDGKDWLHGGRGEDVLEGGAGADILHGADASGSGIGDDAQDTASYATSSGGVYVSLTERRGLRADAEGDRLAGIERVIGSAFDDHLVAQEAVTPWGTYFDAARYLASNPDLRAAFGTDHARATRHWETTGHLEARHGAMMVGGSILAADAGNDTVHGGGHNDYLLGGTGNDRLEGQGGHDWLYGEAGNDTLNGGDHGDRLYGGEGDDTLIGYWGNDWLYGDNGNDTLHGGAEMDTLYGGAGDDTLNGSDGDDRIHTGLGQDRASGGTGYDRFLGTREELAFDVVTDFGREDRLVVQGVNLSHLNGTTATDRIMLDGTSYVTLTGIAGIGQFYTHWNGSATEIWVWNSAWPHY